MICPVCKKDLPTAKKAWEYGRFHAEAYLCENCGTRINEYSRNGKHSFSLMVRKGKIKRWVKV